MTYNKSRGAVYRHRAYLDAMLNGRKTLSWPSSNPNSLAYKIREALAAAQEYEIFERYHELKHLYRISVNGGWVEAVYLGPEDDPISGLLARKPQRMRIEEASSVQAVVGACIELHERAVELFFPNVIVEDEENLAPLFRWGARHMPPWKIIHHGEEGLTMTRRPDVDKEFIWTPERLKDED